MKIKEYIDNFRDPNLMHYSASLSFHTILSIVPILLISLSLFTKMPNFSEYYESIRDMIFSSLLPTHQGTMSGYIDEFLQNTSKMGAFGMIFAFFVSIMFFKDYGEVVAKVTNTPERTFWDSISTYWTLLTLTPIAIALSFFISNYLQSLINEYTTWINLFAIFPYFIIWALFFILYKISINKKLGNLKIAIGSFIGSSLWFISKTIFVYYVTYNKTYLSVYGSFSILMFFFIWVYLSWIIFIYGLKLSSIEKD